MRACVSVAQVQPADAGALDDASDSVDSDLRCDTYAWISSTL